MGDWQWVIGDWQLKQQVRSPKAPQKAGLFRFFSPRKDMFSPQERHTGIEPASSAWEADALPMC